MKLNKETVLAFNFIFKKSDRYLRTKNNFKSHKNFLGLTMGDLILTGPALERAKSEIDNALIQAGVHTVLLIDQAGNVVASCGKNSKDMDITALAALAAANFGATSQIAKLIGEDDFSLLFHKGKRDSIHFAKIGKDFILVTIFSDEVSLGLVRLRVAELSNSIQRIFDKGTSV